MPRPINETARIDLRLEPEQKAKLAKAAALERTDLTGFILRTAVPAAEAVIDRAERRSLDERDSLRVLDLLDDPPPANAKLIAAARLLRASS